MALDMAFGVPIFTERLIDDFSILHRYTKTIIPNGDEEEGLGMTEKVRFLDDYKLFDVKAKLQNYFNTFFVEILGGHPGCEPVITTSWLTYQKEGSHNNKHKHMNSWFSGVLYFDNDYTDAAKLELKNPLVNYTSFCLDVDMRFRETSEFNIVPEPNKLVLFPSYLFHTTSRQNSKKTRHSLAFNVLPKRAGVFEWQYDSQFDVEWLSS